MPPPPPVLLRRRRGSGCLGLFFVLSCFSGLFGGGGVCGVVFLLIAFVVVMWGCLACVLMVVCGGACLVSGVLFSGRFPGGGGL
jgi:hypothetical protein